MPILAIEPHRQLQPYVLSYRVVEDKLGEFSGKPIWTCPEPIGVLSANFGKCSYHESGKIHPKVGLLGIQTQSRKWIAQSETLFVMAILTVPGMMTLFPEIGPDSADSLLDLAGVWGDRKAGEFWRCLPHHLRRDEVKSAMDGWLLNLLSAVPIDIRKYRLQLYRALTCHRRIDTACEQLGITPRTLQREFRRHIGVSPKQVMSLHRLQRSVKDNVETASQSSVQEFADQSHEIRTWRRYLNRTPSRYRTEHRSVLARAFASSAQSVTTDPTIFYL
ncbi:MAG: helix-turn-helix domain-containing protein [Cyanobacteria bacterium J06614_10]